MIKPDCLKVQFVSFHHDAATFLGSLPSVCYRAVYVWSIRLCKYLSNLLIVTLISVSLFRQNSAAVCLKSLLVWSAEMFYADDVAEPQFMDRRTGRTGRTGRTHWLLDRTAALLSWRQWWWWRWIFPLCCLYFQLSDSFYRLFADQRSWTKNCWDKITETHGRK